MKQLYFYDTNSLLDLQEEVFTDDIFYISNITLKELENIKTAYNKDEQVKFQARKVLHLLNDNESKFKIIIFKESMNSIIMGYDMPINDDSKILACAYDIAKYENIVFVTNDLSCKQIASMMGLKTKACDIVEDTYTGYTNINMSDEELANFYNNIIPNQDNCYNLLLNEYLIINCGVDKYKWTEDGYKQVTYKAAESIMFGKIKPQDDYQFIALDSLYTNQINLLRGPAGSGKSYLALGYMFHLLEANKIDKIIIFCNTVATKGAAKLGFYPGSRVEKLLDSQIGNFLESKLGSKIEVEALIDEGRLLLLPMSDIRGFDTTGMNAAVYITEAQNLDIELIKLALQRIGEDSICILDGDDKTQVDLSSYAGLNNGIRRVSKIFRNHDFYGEVTLAKIHRSKIAELAQEL